MNKLLFVVGAAVLAAAQSGCSAGIKAAQPGTAGTTGAPGSAGSSGTTGSAGTSGTAGATGSSGSTGNSGGVVDSGVGADAACATESTGAVPVPLDLYFLMDSSKSMADNTGAGTSKWSAVGAALGTFFNDAGSAGLGVALKYFPDEQAGAPATCSATSDCGSFGACDFRNTCVASGASTTAVSPLCIDASTCGTQTCSRIKTCSGGTYCAAGPTAPATACSGCSDFAGYCHLRDICTGSKYATPDVPMMTLPGGASALTTSLAGHLPDGYTPTGPALTGAVMYAQQRLSTTPDHKVAIVLVTDGLPGGFLPGFPPAECAPSDVATIASSILTPAATANPPILTFVVGIFNPASQEGSLAPANLKTLAQAGGTGNAVIIDVTSNTVTQQLHDALAQAQTKAIACSYKIPPPSHGNIDFGRVNVQFTKGSGEVMTIGHTTSKSACDKGGWYYDVDPASGTPTQIIACDSTCAQFQTDTTGHVDIVLGCMTITVS